MHAVGGAVGEQATYARIERLFAMLRRFRQELAREPAGGDGAGDLFARTARLAVDLGGFRFAWVGVVDRARRTVVPVAHAGVGASYLDGIEVGIEDGPSGRGPTGTAVREGRSVVCANIDADASFEPWRAHALAHGFRSSGAFPVRRGADVYATLNVYADAPGFAAPVESTMMDELGLELGRALDAMDREAARRAMEARLVESENRYRGIVECAADGVVVFTGGGRIVDANPAFCAMFGYAREELLRMRLAELAAPEKRESYDAEIAQFHARDPGATLSVDRVGRRRDGRRIDLEVHVTIPARGTAVSVVRDVTERKRVDAERAATERLVSLGRLAQSVGHEINNPLSYLTLRLEHARTLLAPLSAELRRELADTLSSVEDGAARIAYVVRALSAFGRGDVDAVEPTTLRSVVDASLSLVANRLTHAASIEVDLGETPPVLVNAFGLTQVVVNLLLNAADAVESIARERHVVRIASRVDARGEVVLEVGDTGPGIPAADLAQVFDAGFTTKPVGKGSGLGLAIVRSIVTSFGGTVDARTAPAGGATFRVVLPAVTPHAAPAPAASEPAASGRRRILVVDDEPLVARTLALVLASHDVTVCTTIAEAFDLCMREDVDVILCDLMMPKGGGMDLYDRLGRERPALRDKMVFMTGGTFTEPATHFLKTVPNPRLMKPFAIDDLLAIVERVAG